MNGPTKISHYSCIGCDHHDSEMVCSGINQVYIHFCKIAKKDKYPPWAKIKSGRSIGTTAETPDWCPIMNKKQVKGN